MKATAQLTVPDEAQLTITLEMTVGDARRLHEQVTQQDAPPSSWIYPLDKLATVLRESIATANASHVAKIDPDKRIGRE